MFKKLLLGFECSLTMLFLISCENFLQGSSLKNELNAIVTAANQPGVTINFSNEDGGVSPVGDYSCKVTEFIPVICTESRDSKKCFVKWTVENKITRHVYSDSEIPSILKFDDISSPNTRVQVLTPTNGLIIKAKCVSRPVAATHSPVYDSDGVYRDRRIDVMFTKSMDHSSIYYDEVDEVPALKANGYELLRDEKRNGRCYGYKDSNGEIHFKNIIITKRTDESVNYLRHYDAPYFDENDSSVLRINANTDNPPPVSADIFVIIRKEMFYRNADNDSPICLQDDHSWSYYTNSQTDKNPPEFVSIGSEMFKVFLTKDDGSKNDSVELKSSTAEFTTTDVLKNNNAKNCKLWVRGMFSDGGSGPSKLEWKIYRTTGSKYYPQVENKATVPVVEGKVDSLVLTGSNARVGKIVDGEVTDGVCIDISEFNSGNLLPEGFYKISFVCYDKNERSSEAKDYYFVHDVTPPKNITVSSTERNWANKAVLYCKNPNYDIEKIVVHSRNMTDPTRSELEESFVQQQKTEYELTVNNLINGNGYAHSFEITDFCGNVSYYSDKEFVDERVLGKSTLSAVQSYASNIAKIKVSNPSPNYSYSMIKNQKFATSSDQYKIDGTLMSPLSYKVTITDYDYSGNSDTYEATVATSPSEGMILYSDRYWCDYNHKPSGKTAVGVILSKDSSNRNVKVWALDETTGYCWGGDQKPDTSDNRFGKYYKGWIVSENENREYQHGSGLEWYNYIMSSYYTHVTYYHEGYHTIWKYLVEKNSNSYVKWYAPGIEEFGEVLNKCTVMSPAFNSFGKDVAKIQQPYWTGIPRYDKQYAHVCSFGDDYVPVKRGNPGTDWKMYANSSSPLKAVWCTSNKREGSWYYKWNYNETYNREGYQEIYIHAMGVIDLVAP
ncbi:hypothetical protein [Treponema sp.]|uniref:hypothetical protein n=1 Tax=Treponema sp. TaxID=166 RepID=UPI003890C478